MSKLYPYLDGRTIRFGEAYINIRYAEHREVGYQEIMVGYKNWYVVTAFLLKPNILMKDLDFKIMFEYGDYFKQAKKELRSKTNE